MNNIAKHVLKFYKFTLLLWLVIAIILSFYAFNLPSKLKGDGFDMEGEYVKVQNELNSTFDFPKNTMVVLFDKKENETTSTFHKQIKAVLTDIEELNITKSIQSPLNFDNQYKENVAYALLSFDIEDDDMKVIVEQVRQITDQYEQTKLTGAPVINEDLNSASKRDLMFAEMIGLPVALIVLLAAFGSLVAATVPIVVGGITVVIALGILTLLGNHLNLSVFLLNVVPMIGLALSIDFALLFINRYKEEREQFDKKQALMNTIQTSGKSIVFSAVCVFIGLAAMLIIDIDIFKTIAIGGMVVVAIAVFTSITLLPALLYLLGDSLNNGTLFKSKRGTSKKWRKFAESIMKYPIIISILATTILFVGIIPVKDMKLTIPDENALPLAYESREAFSVINKEFGLRENTTAYIIAKRDDSWISEEGLKDLQVLIEEFEKDTLVESTTSLYSIVGIKTSEELYGFLQTADGRSILEPYIQQFIKDDQLLLPIDLDTQASSTQAQDWVRKWDEKEMNVDIQIGGEAKFNQEIFDEISNNIWYGIAIVLVSTYLILLVAFRSVIIPLKAILMNVAGLACTFGILVWIFQEGQFGIDPTTISLIIPVFVFSLVFGLSMDYEVFLISRIQEEYQKTYNNDEATVIGLSSTSKIITSAALIMIVLTGAFAFTGVVPVKQIGIGIAVAIFIDATIIRLLLVPSLMKLLGDWNWWLPFVRRTTKKKHD